jgi:hypothetical protein
MSYFIESSGHMDEIISSERNQILVKTFDEMANSRNKSNLGEYL